MARSFWVETLGCPKNQVDSDKLVGTLAADGLVAADGPGDADLVVVNTCAFIEEARAESVETVLTLAGGRRPGAELVVTGCMAERYGDELASALPEADVVAGFGVPVHLGRRPGPSPAPSMDLLELPRPAASAPWAYVKVAEGCDRACGFCAIPSFRGPQRSRSFEAVLAEVDTLADGRGGVPVAEIVLVAQDLAAYGRDQGSGARRIVPLVRAVAERVSRVRLLYLYPSDLTDGLVEAVCDSGVPYFDLSLQHVSRPLLRRMRRWGDAPRFLARIDDIRRRQPEAALRSSFIVGYPGETEGDHDQLLSFLDQAQLDWCGFFPWSPEDGTYAAGLDGRVDGGLVAERLAECSERQDAITARRRDALVGTEVEVLVDRPGVGRTYREAPEIDGIVHLPESLVPGSLATVRVTAAAGPDLVADGAVGLALDAPA
ncbi:MAG: MiaB/RimO family radical SAM methylthiotransferase [Actinobacteria bacterium]|nr:MiaB/RimO family radical SAM methylthiotransferase [Actinomycetota bacterium]